MKILALEFSSPERSVAVLNEDGSTAGEAGETVPGPATRPLAMIESALKQASWEREQIEGIAVGLGPGSYSGIRTAIALAQGWQLARGVKLIAVSSAEGIAAQAQTDGLTGRCSVVIDAQRGEYYLAGYQIDAGRMQETSPLHLASLEMVRAREQAGDLLIGPEVLSRFPGGRIIHPRAGTLGRLGLPQRRFLSGPMLAPIYLRATNFVKAPPARSFP
jgi:tRNA threonylcarbamoyladenosine biosynthesis protein TsaB